jgi:hypothetical protein
MDRVGDSPEYARLRPGGCMVVADAQVAAEEI